MKVCYVTHLPNLTGASQSLLDLLSEVQRGDYNIEPTVLLGKHGPLEEELKARGVPYKVLRYTSEISDKNPFKTFLKRLYNAYAIRNITDWFEAEGFDLVHNNTLLTRVGMEAARKAHIPYVSHNREFVWEDHGIKLLKEKESYKLMEQAGACIAISDAVFVKFSKLVPKASFVTLYDGLDVGKYESDHEPLFAGETVKVLLAGRLSPGKGQREALEAFELLKHRGEERFELLIVGGESVKDKAYAEELRTYAETHELHNVRFLGFSDLKELRQTADIALVCSKAEALGRVTIESELAGCLTIGAAAGATTELLEDRITGLLYESGDPEALAGAVLWAANHVDECRRIAAEGKRRAATQFDLSTYVTEIEKLYRSVLS
ncbi:MAG: glycosyltransferase family 4 protein [Clostridia bacterium]|nr:glycosyltransferase family 4 protein [Clostridia bacterium]